MFRVTEKDEESGKVEFMGKVDSKGRKQGKGVEYTDNCEIRGYFINDKPEGEVELYFTDDQSYAYANMRKGVLEGPYDLYNSKGKKIFSCRYKKGEKNGKGYEILKPGCKLVGTWKNDEFHGKGNYFYYPDGSYIKGDVEEGEFICGKYYTKQHKFVKELKPDIVNRDEMPENPLDEDPYEKKTIYVKDVKSKGQGMFAKRKIPKDQLCSLYAGVLVPHYVVDRRRWEFNSNTIECDDKYSIDVPEPYHLMK